MTAAGPAFMKPYCDGDGMHELAGCRRILIVGCCGAGKTTLAGELGRRLGLPVCHLDRIWWRPGWTEKPREEFDFELSELLRKESWIVDGNYQRTFAMRLERADFVILLNFSRWVCLWRIVRRFLQYRGRSRPDIGDGCRERITLEFLRYVWGYQKKKYPEMKALIAGSGVPVRIVHSPRELRRWLEKE